MGLTSRTFGSAVGSCEVVGVRVGLCVGSGAYWYASMRAGTHLVSTDGALRAACVGSGAYWYASMRAGTHLVSTDGSLRAAARRSLGDGFVAGTLGSGAAGIRGRSTLGDGVTVVGGAGVVCWSDGRRISRSFWMAWDRAMVSLVEDGTVPPRAVSVSVAWMSVRSVSEIFGVVQCVGYRRHVSATRYRRVLGM